MLKAKQAIIERLLVVLAAVLLCCFVTPAAHAQTGGTFANSEARCQQIRQEVAGSDVDGVYLTEYIVKCVKTIATEVFEQFIEQFYPYVEAAITAVLTLAVCIFGVLMLTGSIEKSSRDSFVLLFKMACVLYFVLPSTAKEIFHMGVDSMDALTDLVFTFGKGTTSGRCIDNATVWDRVDCLLDILIGIKKNGGGAGGASQIQGISRGLLHFNFASMFSQGGVGFMIGAIMYYVVLSVIMATIKSIQTYLAAIIGIAFMLIFEPMFVPMIMFKVSREFFNKWHRIATAFVLQPVILFGFLSFMMIAFDKMVCGQGGFLTVTFGQQGCQPEQYPSDMMEKNGAIIPSENIFGANTSADASEKGGGSKVKDGVFSDAVPTDGKTKRAKQRDQSFGSMGTMFDAIDYSKLCQGGGDAAKCQEQVGYAAITLALTAFVFISMLNYIPNLATDLSGGLYEVPNLFQDVGSKLPGGEALEKKLAEAGEKMSKAFEGMFSGGKPR